MIKKFTFAFALACSLLHHDGEPHPPHAEYHVELQARPAHNDRDDEKE